MDQQKVQRREKGPGPSRQSTSTNESKDSQPMEGSMSGIQKRGSNDVQEQNQDNSRKIQGTRGSQDTLSKNGSLDSRDTSGRKIEIQEERIRKQREPSPKSSLPEDQIRFYEQFAEKVVANLEDIQDKVLAARWILFLEQQPISVVRAEYLKQLLFVCLHGRLVGVFAKQPSGTLEQLPEQHKIEWLARQVTLSRHKDQIPVQQEMSEARSEYLAVQNIPYYGTHCFFAVSDDPIENWENAPK